MYRYLFVKFINILKYKQVFHFEFTNILKYIQVFDYKFTNILKYKEVFHFGFTNIRICVTSILLQKGKHSRTHVNHFC